MPEIRDVEQLRARCDELRHATTTDDELVWFCATKQAEEALECWDIKDLATLFRDGIPEMRGIGSVTDWIRDVWESCGEDTAPNFDAMIKVHWSLQ